MLWAQIETDGTLVIRAEKPIEAYALRQWEAQRARVAKQPSRSRSAPVSIWPL